MTRSQFDIAGASIMPSRSAGIARRGATFLARAAGAVLLSLCAAMPLAASAQPFPNRPIRLMTSAAPGSTSDMGTRLYARGLETLVGQPVIVDNRPGGGGRIATEAVMRAPPDGYTLLFANSVTHGSYPATTTRLTYDPGQDFTHIAPLYWYSVTLMCNRGIPVRNVAELVAFTRSRPEGVTYSSSGIGSGSHFMGELLAHMTGAHLVHVPYRGNAQSLQDVVSGTVDCTFNSNPSDWARQLVANGDVRPLGTSGIRRNPLFPDLPTLDEEGLKGFDLVIWQAVMGPAGIPANLARFLSEASNRALERADIRERMPDLGLSPLGGDGASLAQLVATEVAKYRRIAGEIGMVFE